MPAHTSSADHNDGLDTRQIPMPIPDFDAIVKIQIGADTFLRIDGRQKTLHRDDGEADVSIYIASQDLLETLRDKKLDVMQAVMTGQIKISGDLKLAAQLQSLIGSFSALSEHILKT